MDNEAFVGQEDAGAAIALGLAWIGGYLAAQGRAQREFAERYGHYAFCTPVHPEDLPPGFRGYPDGAKLAYRADLDVERKSVETLRGRIVCLVSALQRYAGDTVADEVIDRMLAAEREADETPRAELTW